MKRRVASARRAELQFARALRKVAANCGKLARAQFDSRNPMGSSQKLQAALAAYGRQLVPWARAAANRMVVDVSRRDDRFWADQSRIIARNLKEEIRRAPTGIAMRQKQAETAAYITSLPLEAGQRVQALSIQYMTQGIRANKLAQDIFATGQVTKSRANTIARTETSRTAALLQEVRSQSVGSEGYIWRTADDIDVRDIHRALAGTYHRWDTPPVAGSRGERAHPGGIYNCRCWSEVILPGEQRPDRARFVAEEVTPIRRPRREVPPVAPARRRAA